MTTCAAFWLRSTPRTSSCTSTGRSSPNRISARPSTRVRHGGFGRVVALRALTTPHGIGYSKIVIVVDETVDPFNLEQVMWALSVKVNPEFDAITIPGRVVPRRSVRCAGAAQR